MKECRKCNKTKKDTDFAKKTKASDGLQSYCKNCNKVIGKNRATQHLIKKANEGLPVRRFRKSFGNLYECLGCNKFKDSTEFHRSKQNKLGLSTKCKSCASQKHRKDRVRTNERRRFRYKNDMDFRASRKAERHNRRAKLTKSNVTKTFLKNLYLQEKCYYCGVFVPINKRTIEHVMPLSRGGKHEVSNLQMACNVCNSTKQDLTEKEFRESLLNS